MMWIIRVLYRFLLEFAYVLRLIWHFILHSVATSLLLGFSGMRQDLLCALNQPVNPVQVGQLGWQCRQETGKLQGLFQTDHHSRSRSKWPKRQKQRFISILKWMLASPKKLMLDAISPGIPAFNFMLVTEPDHNIFATEMKLWFDSCCWRGRESNKSPNQTIHFSNRSFKSITIHLTTYTYDRILHTAEHELGHAIGLEHTNEVSVMQPAGHTMALRLKMYKQFRNLFTIWDKPFSSSNRTSWCQQW